ncbi:unnamed protein product [Closterium sp. NIES-54]
MDPTTVGQFRSGQVRSGLQESLALLPRSPAPPCTPCVEGQKRAAPHSSSFPPTTAPFRTLLFDVWGPSPVRGPRQECYFLIVVDDYYRYTTVLPLRRKADVPTALEPWLLSRGEAQALCGLHLHSDSGGEFSSTCLETSCQGRGIIQSYTLPDSPQQNGVAGVRYSEHLLSLWPSDAWPPVMPISLWTGVSHVTPRSSPLQHLVPVVSGGAGGAVTEGVGIGAAGARGASSTGAGGVRVETTPEEDTAILTQRPWPASPLGFLSIPQFPRRLPPRPVAAEPGGVPGGGTRVPGGVVDGGSGSGGARAGDTSTAMPTPHTIRFLTRVQRLDKLEREERERVEEESWPPQQVQLQPPQERVEEEPHLEQEEQQHRQVPLQQTPEEVEQQRLRDLPDSAPARLPPGLSLTVFPDPLSNYLRASRPVVSRVMSSLVTHVTAPPLSVSALVTTVASFASSHPLDYASHLASGIARSPSTGGVYVFPLEVLEDRQFELGFLATAVPHLCAMLLDPDGDPHALDILIPRTHAEAVSGPCASYWIAAEEAEMASYRSTDTYVDAVPPREMNVVSGMWIYKVNRPPGSPPGFKARYVARGFSKCEGLDYFQTFAPTLKMTTLRVLLHIAAQRDYDLHSLDFSIAFLQGSLHEQIWLRRLPVFTRNFPPGTQWQLQRPIYGLHQAPHEWHDTLRTTLAALEFFPSSANPSLFVRRGSTRSLFWSTLTTSSSPLLTDAH